MVLINYYSNLKKGEIAMETVKEKEKKQAGKANVQEKSSVQEMMKVYQDIGTPGEPHKLLAKMEGSWITKSRYWTDPGKPLEESVGTSEQEMVLEGHFLHDKENGIMMGNPVTSMGFTGYDNNTRKYVSVWMSSMSTAIYFFEGTASADGKTITLENRYNDPVKGAMKFRAVLTNISDNSFRFEMFGTDKTGKEAKMTESEYTRKPGTY